MFEIWGQRYGTTRQSLLCHVETNPEAIAAAYAKRRVFLGVHEKRRIFADKYSNLEIRRAGRDRS